MRIEIELTEEQEKEIEQIREYIYGEEFFTIPAQIKIKNWDNSQTSSKIIGRVLVGDDATEMTRMINSFMREYKAKREDSTQKNIEI